MKILALSGSLRRGSYNTAALNALKALVSPQIEVTIGSIGDLPLFNPDQESEPIKALNILSQMLDASDGLIISSPEYAHGISGPMKNALDWLVGGAEFPYKPIMLINTSPRASHAQAALIEVLTTMSGNIITESCVSIPLLGSELDVDGIMSNRPISNALMAGVRALCDAIEVQTLNKSPPTC